MNRFLPYLLALGLAVCAVHANAEDKPAYLTKDGQLVQKLQITDVQGGFAGFTGQQWTIEPSGKWSVAKVFNEKIEVELKGEMTKEQLAALAKELEKYDLLGLESKEMGKPQANPHVVTVSFGKKEVKLTLGAGEALPKVDTEKPKSSIPNRYSGIVTFVQTQLAEKKDKPKDK